MILCATQTLSAAFVNTMLADPVQSQKLNYIYYFFKFCNFLLRHRKQGNHVIISKSTICITYSKENRSHATATCTVQRQKKHIKYYPVYEVRTSSALAAFLMCIWEAVLADTLQLRKSDRCGQHKVRYGMVSRRMLFYHHMRHST